MSQKSISYKLQKRDICSLGDDLESSMTNAHLQTYNYTKTFYFRIICHGAFMDHDMLAENDIIYVFAHTRYSNNVN